MSESINRIEAIQGRVTSPTIVKPVTQSITQLKRDLLANQYMACKYGSWSYYQNILELQEQIKCRQEIMAKYSYDGKSTFAELLEQEIKKNNCSSECF